MINQWKGENLGNLIAIDTETEMITSPGMVPRLVLTSVSNGIDSYIVTNEFLQLFLRENRGASFIMHNAPFDLGVIKKNLGVEGYSQFQELLNGVENDELFDTQILYWLISLAKTGIVDRKSSLSRLVKEYCGIILNKDDNIRLNFGDFLQPDGAVDYASIPDTFYQYALEDASSTWKLFQEFKTAMNHLEVLHGIKNQTRLSHKIQLAGAIALDDIQKTGIGFDLGKKQTVLDRFEKEMETHRHILRSEGFIRGQKGCKKVYAEVVGKLGLNLPRTATGGVSSASDDLKQYALEHPFINSYIKFHEIEKLSSFIRNIDSNRIYPRYNLLMNTGRTSSFGPNIQQLPRTGGIRELFVPAPGKLFLDVDYNFLELCTLAQTNYNLFGYSKMRDLINEGKDLHIYAASQIYSILESEVKKDQRQLAKILNFGLGANMSPATFVEYATSYGVKLNLSEATELKKKWLKVFPEMNKFYHHKRDTGIHITNTGRIRSDCTYTAFLNTYFQGMAADGAKLSLYLLYKHGYKVVAFIHDQVLIETDNDNIKEKLIHISNIMIKGMKMVCPDVHIGVDAKMTTTFSK